MEDQHAHIHALVETWKPRLGLADWIINIEITDELAADDADCEASITSITEYKEANLKIFPLFWRFNDEHQEINIVHELTHCLTSRLHPFLGSAADDAEEEVVQSIAMVFVRLAER